MYPRPPSRFKQADIRRGQPLDLNYNLDQCAIRLRDMEECGKRLQRMAEPKGLDKGCPLDPAVRPISMAQTQLRPTQGCPDSQYPDAFLAALASTIATNQMVGPSAYHGDTSHPIRKGAEQLHPVSYPPAASFSNMSSNDNFTHDSRVSFGDGTSVNQNREDYYSVDFNPDMLSQATGSMQAVQVDSLPRSDYHHQASSFSQIPQPSSFQGTTAYGPPPTNSYSSHYTLDPRTGPHGGGSSYTVGGYSTSHM